MLKHTRYSCVSSFFTDLQLLFRAFVDDFEQYPSSYGKLTSDSPHVHCAILPADTKSPRILSLRRKCKKEKHNDPVVFAAAQATIHFKVIVWGLLM